MTLSPEQLNCVDTLRTSSENLLIKACAGGAKTTTLVAIASAFGPGQRVVALAFNKEAALSLQYKMPYFVESTTFHAFCYSALGTHLGKKPKVDGNKTKWILKDLVPKWSERMEIEDDVLTLVSRAKSTASAQHDEAGLRQIADRFDIEATPKVLELATFILLTCATAPFKTIDFDDMLWLTWKLGVSFPPVALVLLDEAQDTNGVQRELLARILNKQFVNASPPLPFTRNRLIAVGDPHQSIYGFRGADHNAMESLRDSFAMRELELSVSWRCSKAVVKEAQKYL